MREEGIGARKMSGQTKTVMGVVSFVGGEWANESPQVLAVSEPSAFREVAKGDLFILVDPPRADASSAVDAQDCQALATTLRDAYYRSSGGVIASLRRALLTVERMQPLSDMSVGMIAMVVRDGEVFLASVGRMAAFWVHDAEVRCFPERLPPILLFCRHLSDQLLPQPRRNAVSARPTTGTWARLPSSHQWRPPPILHHT